MIRVNEYVGIDISPFIVDQCRCKFKEDATKNFFTNDEFLKEPFKAELTLSLDVIFHLVEDEVFEGYMNMLFAAARNIASFMPVTKTGLK